MRCFDCFLVATLAAMPPRGRPCEGLPPAVTPVHQSAAYLRPTRPTMLQTNTPPHPQDTSSAREKNVAAAVRVVPSHSRLVSSMAPVFRAVHDIYWPATLRPDHRLRYFGSVAAFENTPVVSNLGSPLRGQHARAQQQTAHAPITRACMRSTWASELFKAGC
jgi:hypothetical protein